MDALRSLFGGRKKEQRDGGGGDGAVVAAADRNHLEVLRGPFS
jgi:hypothetical protein